MQLWTLVVAIALWLHEYVSLFVDSYKKHAARVSETRSILGSFTLKHPW